MGVSEIDLAYAAGILDGEGCITISRKNKPQAKFGADYVLFVEVGNTDKRLIEWLHSKFGGRTQHYEPRTPRAKESYHWYLGFGKAKELLLLLLPYLKLKEERARLAIEFQEIKSSSIFHYPDKTKTITAWAREEELAKEMRRLNKKGRAGIEQ